MNYARAVNSLAVFLLAPLIPPEIALLAGAPQAGPGWEIDQ